MDKNNARKRFLKIRREIPENIRAEKSRKIAEKLFETEEFKTASFVFSYASYGAEVETRGIIERAFFCGKRIALPVMLKEKGRMAFIEVNSFEGLVKNKIGIFEPLYDEEKVVFPKEGDVVIVPGAAFNARGVRIGYGGGYYDRYLSRYGEGFKIGICFKEQLAEDLPESGFDIRTDTVITD